MFLHNTSEPAGCCVPPRVFSASLFVTADLSETKAIIDDNNNISLCVWTKFRLGVKIGKKIKEREDKGTVRKSKRGERKRF